MSGSAPDRGHDAADPVGQQISTQAFRQHDPLDCKAPSHDLSTACEQNREKLLTACDRSSLDSSAVLQAAFAVTTETADLSGRLAQCSALSTYWHSFEYVQLCMTCCDHGYAAPLAM